LSSTATDGGDTKGEHKAIAIRQSPHDSRPTSKEKPIFATKTNPQLLLISKNDFTFAETSSKNTLYRAPIALALYATSLPTKPRAAPIVDRPSWAIIFHHLISL